MKPNYNEKMEQIIELEKNRTPKLLLHTCCGPCSTAVIERLTPFFDITVFYYNPNIEPYQEYIKRKEEQKRFLKMYSSKNKLDFLDCDYDHETFQEMAKGLEHEKEGGARCHQCYLLRLRKTAFIAKEKKYDYFGTSLTVSPYKNASVINDLGRMLSEEYHVPFLYSDFKKKDGYKKSIDMSLQYELYRQNYCGCHYSYLEMKKNLTFME